MKTLLLACTVPFSVVVAHAACTDVIALSRLQAVSVNDQSNFDRQARDFCREYRSDKSKAASSSLSISYGGASLGFGGSNAKAEAIYERTCDAANAEALKQDAYRNYVETVAPGAFDAYTKCVAAEASTNLEYSVNGATSREMTIGVTYKPRMAASPRQTLRYSVPGGVQCGWVSSGWGARAYLEQNSTAVLQCKRSTADAPTYITVFSETASEYPATFPWRAYQGEVPISQIANLQDRLVAAEAALNSLSSGILAFETANCPVGWVEYAPAYGRFVRGIDKGNPKIDPEGMRAPGSLQASATGTHKHDISDPVVLYRVSHFRDAVVTRSFSIGNPSTNMGLRNATATDNGLAPETRPANISLLYCVRK